MSFDEDFYELATRFPRAALALAGIVSDCEYRTEAVEVERTRRIDVLFQPAEPGAGPTVYLEFQARHDPEIERNLLEKVVLHSVKERSFEDVLAVILYTEGRLRRSALPADIGPSAAPVVRFEPLRVVLDECSPALLEAEGPIGWIVLPLVGRAEEVAARAGEWHERLQHAPELADEQRRSAVELFVRLLADRLGNMDVSELLARGERAMEDTVTGQRLIERGIERGIERERRESVIRVLGARFGAVPAEVVARLGELRDLEALERLVICAATIESLAAFETELART